MPLLPRWILPIVFLLAAPSSASAAYFVSAPDTYQQSGAGPFTYEIRSEGGSGSHGSSAYKLSTEAVWHRCGKDQPAQWANLAEGSYTIDVADDMNPSWYAARGQLYSGAMQPCHDVTTTDSPGTAVSRATLIVDGTAPTVTPVTQTSEGTTVQFGAQASDATAGVDTAAWKFGDGGTTTGTLSPRYRYLNYGTYDGSLTVVDKAGNAATQSFRVTVSAPPPGAGSGATPPVTPAPLTPSAPADPLRLQLVAAARIARNARAVNLSIRCNRVCMKVTLRTTVTIGRRRISVRPRNVYPGTRVTNARVTLPSAVQRSMRTARRAGRTVRIQVVAVGTRAADGESARDTTTVRVK